LDGLRFLAAFFVAAAHFVDWTIAGPAAAPVVRVITDFSNLGMATFFVLSGFVIHYNYHDLRKTPGGIRRFL
jgi:peptidoglycan/LPS O-acetylase OafA/YrhL